METVNVNLLLQLTSAYLLVIGIVLVLLKRNTLVMLLGVELCLNSANLALVTYSKMQQVLHGQLQVLFVIAIAAAESAIGLSIVINLYRNFGSIKSQNAQLLKG